MASNKKNKQKKCREKPSKEISLEAMYNIHCTAKISNAIKKKIQRNADEYEIESIKNVQKVGRIQSK